MHETTMSRRSRHGLVAVLPAASVSEATRTMMLRGSPAATCTLLISPRAALRRVAISACLTVALLDIFQAPMSAQYTRVRSRNPQSEVRRAIRMPYACPIIMP